MAGGVARFFPDNAPKLDRIAAAIDAGSNYGANPGIRRADPDPRGTPGSPYALVSERLQGGIIEALASVDILYPDRDVSDHL